MTFVFLRIHEEPPAPAHIIRTARSAEGSREEPRGAVAQAAQLLEKRVGLPCVQKESHGRVSGYKGRASEYAAAAPQRIKWGESRKAPGGGAADGAPASTAAAISSTDSTPRSSGPAAPSAARRPSMPSSLAARRDGARGRQATRSTHRCRRGGPGMQTHRSSDVSREETPLADGAAAAPPSPSAAASPSASLVSTRGRRREGPHNVTGAEASRLRAEVYERRESARPGPSTWLSSPSSCSSSARSRARPRAAAARRLRPRWQPPSPWPASSPPSSASSRASAPRPRRTAVRRHPRRRRPGAGRASPSEGL